MSDTFHPACAADDVPEGGKLLVKLGPKQQPVLIVRQGGHLFAIDPWCTHAYQSLESGIVRDCWIACPAHGARFDLATGEVLGPPAARALPVYALREAGGMIEVAV